MASGFQSLHPDQEKRLRAVGLRSSQVTQGWGYATASAGSHTPVGTRAGRKFGWCIDLSIKAKPDAAAFTPNKAHVDALVLQGFCPFYRSGGSWVGNEHWHIVDVTWLRNDAGKVPLHGSIPRRQVTDFLGTPPRNGLVGHAELTGWRRPTARQQAYLRNIFERGAEPTPDLQIVKVIGAKSGRVIETLQVVPNGNHIADQGKLYVTED